MSSPEAQLCRTSPLNSRATLPDGRVKFFRNGALLLLGWPGSQGFKQQQGGGPDFSISREVTQCPWELGLLTGGDFAHKPVADPQRLYAQIPEIRTFSSIVRGTNEIVSTDGTSH